MTKTESLRDEYGEFLAESPTVGFDSRDVPEDLRALIPHAGFWGLADDLEREQLVGKAPDHLKRSLQNLISANDEALDAWLGGEEASNPNPSAAYIAFSAMRMAADFM